MDVVVTVDRMPRQGETITGRSWSTFPGGKGANQALAASRAGGDVTFLGAVGDDDFGRHLTALLHADGVDITGVSVVDQPTGTAHITVDGAGRNAIVVIPGANGSITGLTRAHRTAIDGAELLLVQLELPLPVVKEAIAFAHSLGVRVLLTPAPVVALPAALLDQVDVLIPNEPEAALLTGLGDPVAAAGQLAQHGGDVIVTRGANGAVHVHGHDQVAVPAFTVPVVDTTAAGDTFVGVLAVALADGAGWAAALRQASAAAALSVQRLGASSSMPTRTGIDTFLTTGAMPGGAKEH
jgi:ribokinase